MPTLLIRQNAKELRISDICLRMLGKTEGRTASLSKKLTEKGIKEPDSIVFLRIIRKECVKDFKKELKIFKKYLKLFPFMRCVKSRPSYILRTGNCRFDVENYSLNEVMFAMFHIRILTLVRSHLEVNAYPYEVMMKTILEHGYKFHEAYLTAFFSSSSEFTADDGNTWYYQCIETSSFVKSLKKEFEKPKLVLRKFKEHLQKERAYATNISEYQAVIPCKNSLKSLYRRIKESFLDHYSSETIYDLFGRPYSIQKVDYNEFLKILRKELCKN